MKSFLFALFIVFQSSIVFAFLHETGNGEDRLPMDFGSAWFVGSSQITYCIESTHDFGISKERAATEVRSVIEKWKKYTSDRKVHSKSDMHKLNFNYKYTIDCEGSESLTIYLGVENPRVLKAKKRFYNPTAFAHREFYDSKIGMGKGFIWLSQPNPNHPPGWSKIDIFHGLALHEFGHVLGVWSCGRNYHDL